MSHQIKCNFSATNLDFSTKLSGFIGKDILRIPETFTEKFHCFKNYSCLNIQFRIFKFKEKLSHLSFSMSNNITFHYEFRNLLDSLSQSMFDVYTTSFHIISKSFCEAQYCLCN